ncbi:MAG: tRNA epoxyqueuosine(34) reductase QueG [Bacteroidetes bacterium]|nr:tRNA epoxyqueuosine(34) reductase QueG [Bacteroidota bacterium]
MNNQEIKTKALEIGFSYCGFAKSAPIPEYWQHYIRILQKGIPDQLDYLNKYSRQRLDPRLVMKEAKTVIALLVNYYPPEIIPEEDNFILGKYAYGKDYHVVIRKKLNELAHYLKEHCPESKTLAFVDSGVLMEKAWAQICGLGWIGKNTILINKNAGSFFFIGILLTDLEIEPDLPETDHCGNCRKCLDACPTKAITNPYELNPALCISFHTIETKLGIPEFLIDKFSDQIYGCDICQDVCPYNKFAIPHQESSFLPDERLKTMRKNDWNSLTPGMFEEIFNKSPLSRIGYDKLMDTIHWLSPQ